MKNIKTIIIIIILLLTGFLSVVGLRAAKTYLSGAAGGSEPKGVNVQADVKSATITWQTEKDVQGIVEYGTTPASLLLRALETQPTKVHRVALSPLKENTTYYFRIRVGETIYDNGGIPYSFKTQSTGAAVPTSGPTSAPTPTSRPISPTVTPAPTSPQESTGSAKVTQCVQSEFKDKYGTKDSRYDFDDNGIVNTRDWIKCLQVNQ